MSSKVRSKISVHKHSSNQCFHTQLKQLKGILYICFDLHRNDWISMKSDTICNVVFCGYRCVTVTT
jgi:hypothetical protein